LRAVWDSERAFDSTVWSHLAEMGVLGVLVPESAGGLGLDEVDMVLVLEELGRFAVPGPLVEHAAVAVPTLALAGDRVAEWLRAAATGEIVISAGSSARRVAYGAEADLVITEHDGVVEAVLSADRTVVEQHRAVDRSRRFADIAWSRATPLPGADPTLFRARGAAGSAAVLCGPPPSSAAWPAGSSR
ncbi:MAG: acyl-CoA dehydrogenase family protein, partial [Actinobacteria bacterium]|nr:acyl-CoA dehydrogenase family protein [Actinomycetota bacterium]